MSSSTGYFIITGYWKSDSYPVEFESSFFQHIVSSGVDPGEDNADPDYDIFYYEMSEEIIKEAISLGIASDFEFVITNYKNHERL